METNKNTFSIFNSERTKDLFQDLVLPKMLQKVSNENGCNCKVFDEFSYSIISLSILDSRKIFLSYPLWLEFHKPSDPLTNNINWNVCVDRDIAHHLFRDGLNEANSNILAQGFNLNFFTHLNQGEANAAFWLYTKETSEGTSFIATTMVFFGFNDLFLFNENGMCLNK